MVSSTTRNELMRDTNNFAPGRGWRWLSDAAAEFLSKHQGQINGKDPKEWIANPGPYIPTFG